MGDELDIKPLPAAARERDVVEWQGIQARFVDDPERAVRDADMTIQSVMRDRGYPIDDFEQRAADVSVDVQHYRLLFDELLDTTADAPLARDETAYVEPRNARETRT